MVPRVGVEGLDAVLPILHKADGQVLVGQSDVIGEVVDARVGADELARVRVVVAPLVGEDLVEPDGRLLGWVAAGDADGEGCFGLQAATPADACGPPSGRGGCWSPGGPGLLALPRGPLFPPGPRSPRSPCFSVGPTRPFTPETRDEL